jgi:hypothetical protein
MGLIVVGFIVLAPTESFDNLDCQSYCERVVNGEDSTTDRRTTISSWNRRDDDAQTHSSWRPFHVTKCWLHIIVGTFSVCNAISRACIHSIWQRRNSFFCSRFSVALPPLSFALLSSCYKNVHLN